MISLSPLGLCVEWDPFHHVVPTCGCKIPAPEGPGTPQRGQPHCSAHFGDETTNRRKRKRGKQVKITYQHSQSQGSPEHQRAGRELGWAIRQDCLSSTSIRGDGKRWEKTAADGRRRRGRAEMQLTVFQVA